MLIRKNTKTFKTIVQLITACQDRADREKLVRLYITKAGHSINDRISVEGIQGEAGLFYEMNYQAVFNNLKSSNHQLHISDQIPGIYFFHSTSNKVWDETPFEFDEAIKKEFSSLEELPLVRKKEKSEKFVLPTPKKVKTESPPVKKEKVRETKAVKVAEKGKKQPDFKLRHAIHFTDLEKTIFRQEQLSKQDILHYYNKVAEYILPYLKDRPLWSRPYLNNARRPVEMTLDSLFQNNIEQVPDWIQPVNFSKGKEQKQTLLSNDREHLLFYVEMGCLEFDPCHSRTKYLDSPDYILIAIDSPESEIAKAIDVALVVNNILSGLKLPSFVKTDGLSGLHIYIPLDSKSKFEISRNAAEYICKLIRSKIPDLVSLKGSDDHAYGKVSLDYSLNEGGESVVAPYSVVAGDMATVATPLLWKEVKTGLRLEDFNLETIFKRLKEVGDPFETLFKKKINADSLLAQLEENYSFLLDG
jgi:DNA ligase D-like protein (predicted polymerase)